jgi:hypothetical protein
MPPPRLAHSAEVYANRMVIFGGYDGKIRMNDVFVLDFGNPTSKKKKKQTNKQTNKRLRDHMI